MQNTPENPSEKAPENPPKDPVLSEHPSASPGVGYLSYRADCPVCKTLTWWRETAHSSWCRECCFSVEKKPSEDALVSIHAGDTIPTKCRDSVDRRETQTAKPHVVGGCDWGGSEAAHIATITHLIETADEALKEARQRVLAAADIKQIVQVALSVRKHTEQEIEELKDWIIEIHLSHTILSLVQKGVLTIEWRENGPVFRPISQPPKGAAEQPEQPNQKEETHE